MLPKSSNDLFEPLLAMLADMIVARLEKPEPRTRLFDVSRAAEYLGRSEDAVKHLAAAGTVPVVRFDRRVMFDRADLDRWIDANKTGETRR